MFFFFAHLIAVLIKDSSILLCASAFIILRYNIFLGVYEKKSGHLLIGSCKGRNMLIDFLDNCGVSFVILHQNLTSKFLTG